MTDHAIDCECPSCRQYFGETSSLAERLRRLNDTPPAMQPCCPECHAPWDRHPGITERCAEIVRLKAKLARQRTELRRLNKTLRSMWDGVRFSHRVRRDMAAKNMEAKK